MNNIAKQDDIYLNIKTILQSARDNTYQKVNFIMVEAYWNIGKQIVAEEQNGEDRAKYGTYLIKELSTKLTQDFGKGFSTRNLRNMRQFYILFPIWQTVSAKLTWSHYYRSIELLIKAVIYIFYNSMEKKLWVAQINNGKEFEFKSEVALEWVSRYFLEANK